MKKTLTTLGIALAMTVTMSGCSKRRIDVDETGSRPVPGTSWQLFCDGPNAVMWVPGRSGDADEIEAYVYEHYQCAPAFYGEGGAPGGPTEDPAQGDPDGLVEDDD